MKIIKLQAENVKRIKAVEIEPKDDVVIISGKNGHGKSSVLDSIWFALGGKDATKDTPKPIRDGQEKASSSVDLGNVVITRKWTSNDKSYLKVEARDGARYPSPQKMLDDLVGSLSFDPLEFSNMENKKQLKTLLSMVSLEIDPDEIEKQKKELYDERTLVNREAKKLEGQLAGMTRPEEGLPEEEAPTSKIMKEYQKANDLLTANNKVRTSYDDTKKEYGQKKSDITDIEEEIKELQTQIKDAKAELKDIEKNGNDLKAKIEKLKDPDLDSYQVKLKEAEQTNEKVRSSKKYRELFDTVRDKKAESQGLTESIQFLDNNKQEAIKKAKFPIEGLGFSEDGVTYKEMPFKQCSSAEQLRVSLAMAMAINPKLKVILIKDGSLLDSDNLELISKMARDKNYQIWVERVSDTGGVGVVIEEGQVRGANNADN